MEIKYSLVTYTDRITALSNYHSQIQENKSSISWGMILGLAALGVITVIIIDVYYDNKVK